MKLRYSLPILFLGLGLVTGCYYDNFSELYPLNGVVDTCEPKYDTTYTAYVNLVVQVNCISCHRAKNPQGNVRLDSYAQVKSQVLAGKLMESIRHESSAVSMPPNIKLRDCDITKMEAWVSKGLPE